ncbi:hypothetical protein F4780DRAFT_420723 [Xylariomycetidae sp. FL0641]|nr:hypothetical protein F4780DRAFT_420723 [Xylariomycetidae sp. FL0641]
MRLEPTRGVYLESGFPFCNALTVIPCLYDKAHQIADDRLRTTRLDGNQSPTYQIRSLHRAAPPSHQGLLGRQESAESKPARAEPCCDVIQGSRLATRYFTYLMKVPLPRCHLPTSHPYQNPTIPGRGPPRSPAHDSQPSRAWGGTVPALAGPQRWIAEWGPGPRAAPRTKCDGSDEGVLWAITNATGHQCPCPRPGGAGGSSVSKCGGGGENTTLARRCYANHQPASKQASSHGR